MSTTTGIIQQNQSSSYINPNDLGSSLSIWIDMMNPACYELLSGNRIPYLFDLVGDYVNPYIDTFDQDNNILNTSGINGQHCLEILLPAVATPREESPFLNKPMLNNNSAYTVITVHKINSVQGYPAAIIGFPGAIRTQYNPNVQLNMVNGPLSTNRAFNTAPEIWLLEHDGTTTTGSSGAGGIGFGTTLYINGEGIPWTNGPVTKSMGTALKQLQLAESTTFNITYMLLGEVIVIDRVLTEEEKQGIYNYLNNRWNIF